MDVCRFGAIRKLNSSAFMSQSEISKRSDELEVRTREGPGRTSVSEVKSLRRRATLIWLHLRRNRPAQDLRIFRGEERALRKFLRQLTQEFLRQGVLLFTACRKRQKGFGKWLEVAAFVSCFLYHLHAEFLVTMNAAK